MKVFIIAIVMWWADPTMRPADDSVEIKTLFGKPLYFQTMEACFDHVDENLEALKGFGRAYYPTSNAVARILCVEKELNSELNV